MIGAGTKPLIVFRRGYTQGGLRHMERRTALIVSISTAATVLTGGLAFASLGGLNILGFSADTAAASVEIGTTIANVDSGVVLTDSKLVGASLIGVDPATTTEVVPGAVPEVVVPGVTPPGSAPRTTSSPTGTPAPNTPASNGGAPATNAPVTQPPATAAPVTAAPTVTTVKPPSTTTPPATTVKPPTTTVKPPTTTTPPTTVAAPSSTLPPGVRIPADWPAGKPIPPIPAGCKSPQLEDNGVWNCQ
jgi:hypothetical protein